MKRRPRIYISGPITKGNRKHNFKQAAIAQVVLIKHGMAVFNPMLSMKLPGAYKIPHKEWLDNDLPWVESSDAVLRLRGKSVGGDMECEHARKHGIPVFTSRANLIRYFSKRTVEV